MNLEIARSINGNPRRLWQCVIYAPGSLYWFGRLGCFFLLSCVWRDTVYARARRWRGSLAESGISWRLLNAQHWASRRVEHVNGESLFGVREQLKDDDYCTCSGGGIIVVNL